MSSDTEQELGPRIEPEPAETVQEVLEDAPAAAQANVTFSAVNGGACRWTPVLTTR